MFSKSLMSTVVIACLQFTTPGLVRADDSADSSRTQKVAQALKDADRHIQADRFVEAEKAYKKVLALDSKNVAALAGLAWVFNHRGDWDEAIDAASDAVEISPRTARHGASLDTASGKRERSGRRS